MTKRKHKFVGEDQAEPLVYWLNSGQSDARKRVTEIMELYSKLGKSVPPPTVRKTGPGALSLRLWELLDRYTFKLDNHRSNTGLVPAPTSPPDESQQVLRVQSLRQMDLLAKVRRCDGCAKWIFARSPGHRFCNPSCQIKAYQSDPQWRARNNAERRRLYHLHKQNPNILTQQRRGTK